MTQTRRHRSLLIHGFGLALKHWRTIAWTYALQFALTWLFTLHLHNQFAVLLSPSLASARLASAFDVAVLAEVFRKVNQYPGAGRGMYMLSSAVFAVIYFLLTPGVIYSYLTGERACLHKLQYHGFQYFWRFVRVAFFAALTFLVILGPLAALQSALLLQLDERGFLGKPAFFVELGSAFVLMLIACVVRLYFDLVETYTVQLGLRDDFRTRLAYRPAARALRQHFLRAFETFALLTFLGLGCIGTAIYFAIHQLAAPHLVGIFVILQLGILLDLFTRFWQRGAVATLAADHLIPLPEVSKPYLPVDVEPGISPHVPPPARADGSSV